MSLEGSQPEKGTRRVKARRMCEENVIRAALAEEGAVMKPRLFWVHAFLLKLGTRATEKILSDTCHSPISY